MKLLSKIYIFSAAFLSVAAFSLLPAVAQKLPAGVDPSFSIASMDPVMAFSKADAVVRLDNQQIEVKSRRKAVWRVHRVITVFNADGRDNGIVVIGYDKLRKAKKLVAQIRNAEGKVVQKLKKNEIEDYSAISDMSLYEDSRIKVARMEHGSFPYTVEYWYEIEFDGYISWPSWEPEKLDLSVEHSRFEVHTPADLTIRYRFKGDNLDPKILTQGNQKVYRWEVTSVRRQTEDLLATLSMEVVLQKENISVKVAPESFEIEGAVGDMRTWASFGSWYYDLNRGRDVLPQGKAFEVEQLVRGITDVQEKVRKIYDHFQSSTRYVSVQLGIGGWRTYDAAYVAERGYGDCKALSNYLMSMLKVAGIESYPTLIYSSKRGSDIEKDFPNNEFNHVILMVPVETDTLWLEATSQIIPFGRIGASNEARYALAVKPSGGTLVRTPASSSRENAQIETAVVTLREGGDAVAKFETTFTGNQQDRVIFSLVNAPHKEKMEWLHDALDIPSFEVVSADFSHVKARQSETRLSAELNLPRYASRTGSRLFLPTNILERSTYVPSEDNNRTKPIRIAYAFYDEDIITYKLPAGYNIEAMPEDVTIETSFALYNASHVVEEGSITYKRTLEFLVREIEAGLYGSYRDFMFSVAKADRAQVVLVAD